jgi:uncharacterized membrane protein (UPF0127 family)
MQVKILNTVSDKLKGVIGKASIEDNEVYVFEDTRPHEQFHMKTVPFPIFILFLDSDYGIIDMKEMEAENGTAKAPVGTIRAVEVSPTMVKDKKLKKGEVFVELFNHMQIKKY